MPDQQPIVLLTRQFDHLQPAVTYEECDCACADDGFALASTESALDSMLHCADVHQQPLDDAHTLLFNPLYNGGVAVLNNAAYQIWQQFQTPKNGLSRFSADQSSRQTIENLVYAGLLQPVEYCPAPQTTAPGTLSAWLHITNACNLRCSYCYLHKTAETMTAETGRAAVDAVFRSAIRHGFKQVKLKFAGGEPTLQLDLVLRLHDYALQQATQHGLELDAIILSNGSLMDPEAIAALKRQGLRVMLSIDGLHEVHDRQRHFQDGRGSFNRVEAALHDLLAAGITPFVSVTVTGSSAKTLPQTVQYLLDRDLPFNLNFVRDNPQMTAQEMVMEDALIIEAVQAVYDVIETQLPPYSFLGALLDRSRLTYTHDRICGVGSSYLVIDPQGNVAKCQLEIDVPVSTVFEPDPLTHVQNSSIGIQNIPVDQKLSCRDCSWRYWCGGGCPALNHYISGSYDTRSPYCNVYQALYPGLLRLEALRLLMLSETVVH